MDSPWLLQGAGSFTLHFLCSILSPHNLHPRYGLNESPPHYSYIDTLIPSVMMFAGGAFGKGLGHEGEPS